jgi:hypothetical protein
MVRQVASDVDTAFADIRHAVGTRAETEVIACVYASLRCLNFSSGVCEPLVSRLRVLPLSDVGWSDWGSVKRICDSLAQMGKLDELLARSRPYKGFDPCTFPLSPQSKSSLSLH